MLNNKHTLLQTAFFGFLIKGWAMLLLLTLCATTVFGQKPKTANKNLKNYSYETDSEGAIVKMSDKGKTVYLIFSAHDYGEGGNTIRSALKKNNVKASFFFTGDFLRNETFVPLIKRFKKDGHYIGSHSDKHLLYADWSKRDSLLVTKEEFMIDMNHSLAALSIFGVKKAKWYLPSYEWYNKEVVSWCKELGLTVINFTPGTGTNADYTTPDMKNYRSSEMLMNNLLKREQVSDLSGNFILIHLGTDKKRIDKFYNHLDELILELKKRGYSFKRLR
jgi:endoglucanase